VRLLVDANLSPRVAVALTKAGLESVHVYDVGLLTAPDRSILEYAAANALVIVSADSDFGELLAASRRTTRPSAVLLRSADRLTPDEQAALLAANLPVVAGDLEAGAVVTIARGRMRIRSLPIVPAGLIRSADTVSASRNRSAEDLGWSRLSAATWSSCRPIRWLDAFLR
jgi:predicted nuclease of predicted toxin-antitoxin system